MGLPAPKPQFIFEMKKLEDGEKYEKIK
jgi:hypothetical protein